MNTILPKSALQSSLWKLSPEFIIRICGIPVSALNSFCSPHAMTWINSELKLSKSIKDQGILIQNFLEKDIALSMETASIARPYLINLRRDIYNERKPNVTLLSKLKKTLSNENQDLINSWIHTYEARQKLRQAGVHIVEQEILEDIPERQSILGNLYLRSAVLLQSAELERNMDRYLHSDLKLDKKSRKIERSLLELLQRAAVKTSPFSTLTSVAHGTLSRESDIVRPTFNSKDRASYIQANIAILARLSQIILSESRLWRALDVALAPGITAERDLIRYVRRRSIADLSNGGNVILDNVHEDLYFLPNGPALQDVIRLTSQADTVGELVELVTAVSSDRNIAEVETLIEHLLRVSLLVVPSLQIDLNSSNPFEVFISALMKSSQPELIEAAEHLYCLQENIARFQHSEPSQRSQILTDSRFNVENAFAALSADSDFVPKVILYEDVVHQSGAINLSTKKVGKEWEEALTPFAEILPIFDTRVAHRMALHGFYLARYGVGGKCQDFIQFSHEFQRDFFGPFSRRTLTQPQFDENNHVVPQENWFKSDIITSIDTARVKASGLLLEAWKNQPGHVVHLSKEYAKKVSDILVRPDLLRQPWSFLCQVIPEDKYGGNLVINQSYAGLSLMFSRFLNALEANDTPLTERLASQLRASFSPGAVLAEIRGGYNSTNLNLHPKVTDFEIVCPGDVSSRPQSEQIHLQDLVIEHDVIDDRILLRHRKKGVEIIPVYLGFLMPLSLPEIHQILLCFSPMGMAQIDLWAGTGEKILIDDVTHYPRVQLDHLVLHREMWKIPSNLFPARNPAESSSDYFLRIHTWREKYSLPLQFFARIDFMDTGTEIEEAVAGPDRGGSQMRKPLYVDLTSWHSLMLLERLVRKSSKRLIISEALPHPNQTWITDEDGKNYVSELLLELYPNKE